MAISLYEYQAAKRASSASDIVRKNGRVNIISTLRDRTPAPQAKPLDEGQVKWGGPSSFNWGTNSNTKTRETGPTVNTTYEFSWPDYGLEPDSGPDEDPANDPDEVETLPAIMHEWTEVARVERVVRVTGSNGAYVDINRMEEVIFAIPTSADGRSQYVRMKFKSM